jgi:hypothetical protein
MVLRIGGIGVEAMSDALFRNARTPSASSGARQGLW